MAFALVLLRHPVALMGFFTASAMTRSLQTAAIAADTDRFRCAGPRTAKAIASFRLAGDISVFHNQKLRSRCVRRAFPVSRPVFVFHPGRQSWRIPTPAKPK